MGQKLLQQTMHRIVIFGTGEEADVCAHIAEAIGPRAVSLAGQTTLPLFAALLGACDAVVCNDSGGMHLAAAVGTRVVAIFGLTDPSKTGPMGSGHRILTGDASRTSRNISRHSAEARVVLESIHPDSVLSALLEVLGET